MSGARSCRRLDAVGWPGQVEAPGRLSGSFRYIAPAAHQRPEPGIRRIIPDAS
jgi:hypothetical protein